MELVSEGEAPQDVLWVPGQPWAVPRQVSVTSHEPGQSLLHCLLGCAFPHGIFTASSNQVNRNTAGAESGVTQKLPGPVMLSVCIQLEHCLRELRGAPENGFSAANPESFFLASHQVLQAPSWLMMPRRSAWLHQEPGVGAEERLGTAGQHSHLWFWLLRRFVWKDKGL